MTTRNDVALLANVSPRTVSNVVNGEVHVAAATRARVLAAIEELDYQPSEMGRMLRVGRSGMIGVVLPELDTPYFAELTRSLNEAAAAHGYTLMIEETAGQRGRERDLLTRAGGKALFEGLVVNPLSLSDADLARSKHAKRPIVLLGEEHHGGYDHVLIDNDAAARDAVEHLIAIGCRDIVAIGAQRTKRSSSELRRVGFEAAIDAAGPGVAGSVEYVDRFTRVSGAEAARRILRRDRLPDALFCFSDVLAVGAMRVLHEAGVRIPEDIAVVGIDDIEEGRYSWPSLTTIAPDKRAIAQTAIDALVKRIGGTEGKPERFVIGHQLIVRESSAR